MSGASGQSKSLDNSVAAPPRRAPSITIDTTNLDSPRHSPQRAVNRGPPDTHQPSLRPLDPRLIEVDAPRPSQSPPVQLTTPPVNPGSASNNLLNVPGQGPASTSSAGHQRSPSLGSSAASGWTQTPSTGGPSDFGEETKHLLKQDEPETPNNPFAFNPKQLARLHDPKDLNVLRSMGCLEGLVFGLWTNVEEGLSPEEDFISGSRTLDDVWRMVDTRKRDEAEGDICKTKSYEEQYQPDTKKEIERTYTEGTAKRTASFSSARRKSSLVSRRTTRSSVRSHVASKGFSDRKRIFGENRIPARKPKNIFQLMWMALHDKILILLSFAAVISLALGFYQSFRPGAKDKVDWVEGVAILVAITIVTVVQSVNDYQKERQFMKLNYKKEDRNVKVIRGGKTKLLNVHDIVVGDILHVEHGDLIPVDGVLPEGHNIRADESAATGESDSLKKVSADYALNNSELGAKFNNKFDPFILSGSKILEGVGKYVVTAVGPNSYHGRTMMSLREEPEDTPLQLKLNRVADMIAKVGGSAALVLFIVLLIKFLAQLPGSPLNAGDKGQRFMQILIVSVTIVVVAVPEGLPLAVTLSLAYATTRMLKDNNLVRVLKACETMGNATTICSDKTGTLTQNKMTVIAGTLGLHDRFAEIQQASTDVAKQRDTKKASTHSPESENEDIISESDAIPTREFFDSASDELKQLLRDSVVLNSTAFEDTDDKGNKEFIGSKTETALLGLAKDYLGLEDVAADRHKAHMVQPIPFSSERKCMGCVIKMQGNDKPFYRLFVKGAGEILLQHSSQIIDVSQSFSTYLLSDQDRKTIEGTIANYASKSLRTIALAYRDFSVWPPKHARLSTDDKTQAEFEDIFNEMVFIGVVGIMDPLRPGVIKAVEDCRRAGVFVRMVTGDNILTAKAIATECGIFTPGGIIMEGPRFRKLTPKQMDRIIPRLQVLARSSPEDKRILVKRLKELGETVAVTGDGTNDGPALKMADVGFSMGIAGTEVAKEASSIILMDDNFASIVKAIMWGRCVSDAVKKFLQLTVNVTAVALAFVSSIADPAEQSALTAVQLLWVNLIMDTFAALALATDPPTLESLNRKPEKKDASIISFNMWKMIFGQAILQLAVTFILNFAGQKIFTSWTDEAMQTVVFNTFVWLQIFNEVNCRRLDNKLNVFSGIHRNYFFIGITVIMVAGQILIIFVGGTAFTVARLDGPQWACSIVLGLLSLPFGAMIRLIPNDFIKIFIPHQFYERKRKSTIIDEEKVTEQWNPAIEHVRDDLLFIKSLRSRRRLGNLGNPKRVVRLFMPSSASKEDTSSHRGRSSTPGDSTSGMPSPSSSPSPGGSRRKHSRSSSAFNASMMVPALVATSLMWSPTSPSTGKRSSDPSVTMNREDLERGEGVELHKDTDPNDPIVGEEAALYSPLETSRPRTPDDRSEKGESAKGHWRGRLSVHSRAASKSSVGSSPVGTQSPSGGLFPPRRDVSKARSKTSEDG